MKCKKCNYNFIYCSTCDYHNHNEEGYCSEKCWKESDEFKLNMKSFLELMDLLTNKGLYLLDAVIENSDNYYFYFQQEILERLKKS